MFIQFKPSQAFIDIKNISQLNTNGMFTKY